MTIRRQWLLILTLTAVLAVFINSAILDSLINKYFLTYNSDTYDYHVNQIEQLARSALLDNSLTERQLSVQFESHLDDPIVSIKLYSADGQLLASAENMGSSGYSMMNGMMNGMMSRMMHDHSEEVDSFNVTNGSAVIGVLHITRYSALNQSAASTMFKFALLRNSLLSFVIVLCILITIGVFVSRRLSRDLTNTAAQALSIDMGARPDFKLSKVREIKIIQTGLDELQNRLKIKQVGRKQVVDEFVHQTRTPLTILKTHLEGLEDGVITMSGEEMKVCQSQIDNISAIISNMSLLLDADRPTEAVRFEEFDLHALLTQIINGMRVPFEKKKISLRLRSTQKAVIATDRYKLSQSVYNLLANAYKFTEPNGAVDVSYERAENGVSIRIRDTGTGISEKDLPHLFDAYYRGENAGRTAGDGLGLFVVKENLEQVGGTVDVRSDPGGGSEFTITIPAKS